MKKRSLSADIATRRLLGGTFWVTLGTATFHLASICVLIIIARRVGANDYGRLILVQTTISTTATLVAVGFGTAATKVVAEFLNRDNERVARLLGLLDKSTLLVASLVSLVVVILAKHISTSLLDDKSFEPHLRTSALGIVFLGADFYFKSVLLGFGAVKKYAVASLLSAAIGLPLWLMLAYHFYLEGAVLGFVVCQAAQATVSGLLMRGVRRAAKLPRSYPSATGEWQEISRVAGPVFLTSVLATPSHWLCQLVLIRSGAAYAEVALLGIAMQWFTALLYLPSIASRVLLPIFTQRLTSAESTSNQRLLQLSVTANLLLVAPIATLISVFGTQIVSLYIMPSGSASFAFTIITLTAVVAAGTLPVGQLMIAENKTWLATAMNGGWAMLYVISAIFLAKYGAIGIGAALAAAYLAHAVWVSIFLVRQSQTSTGT